MAISVVEKTRVKDRWRDVQRMAPHEIQSGQFSCDRQLFEHNMDDSGGEIRRACPGEDCDGKLQVIKVAFNSRKKSHRHDAIQQEF